MCGRATLTTPAEDVASFFEADPIDIGPARFNIAPTQPMLTVRPRSSDGSEAAPVRELALVRWGLIPWWAKADEAKKIAGKCIQARAETAPRAPAFRDAFRRHRCLVIVDGFFEWKTFPDGRRVPHHIRRPQRQPFAFAGLWDSWRTSSDEASADTPPRVESCAVLTTRSAGLLSEIHDRMPLVLSAAEWSTWLGGSEDDARRLIEQSRAVLDERARDLTAVAVSTWVNDVRHDDPRCIEPAPAEVMPGLAAAGEAGRTGRTGRTDQMDFGFEEPLGPARAPTQAKPGRRSGF